MLAQQVEHNANKSDALESRRRIACGTSAERIVAHSETFLAAARCVPDGGKSWRSELIYQGEGTHEAVRADLDGSGTHVIFGHSAQIIAKMGPYTGWVLMFRPREKAAKII